MIHEIFLRCAFWGFSRSAFYIEEPPIKSKYRSHRPVDSLAAPSDRSGGVCAGTLFLPPARTLAAEIFPSGRCAARKTERISGARKPDPQR
jgi:hypothetical protein